MKPISTIEKKIIDDYLQEGKRLAGTLEKVSAGTLVCFLRKRLFLTQRNLAKKAGVPQSTIYRIEKGEVQPGEKILSKIFWAMESEIIVLPIFQRHPEEILRARAKKIAQKRMQYLEGAMALEKQKPDKKWMDELLKEEIEEILRHPSRIWDEDE